jgi:hypothetical protein
MTIDPAGTTFWYLGEYSKDTGTTDGRWGTYISSFSYNCTPGTANNAPVVAINAPADNTSFDEGVAINFSGTATDTEDGTLSSAISWSSSIDGTIGSGAGFSISNLSVGSHAITAAVVDSGGRSGSATINITVAAVGGGTVIHVGDLDGSTTSGTRNRWSATVTITVHDQSDAPIGGVTVAGSWSNGTNGGGTCVTDGSGACSISKNNLKANVGSVTFTVDSLSSSGATYDAGANHDPDPDSDGTVITIAQP